MTGPGHSSGGIDESIGDLGFHSDTPPRWAAPAVAPVGKRPRAGIANPPAVSGRTQVQPEPRARTHVRRVAQLSLGNVAYPRDGAVTQGQVH